MDDDSGLDARLQQLLAKRGQELVKGLTDEITRLHREIALLRRELGALADYQSMRDRWLATGDPASQAAALPRNVTIEPDQMLSPRDGFYPAEFTAGGVAFRWTGPTREFIYDVFVERSQGASLKLEVLNCIDYEAQKDLKLLVDGEPVPLETTQEGTGFEVRAVLPMRHDGRSSNLVFVVPVVMSPPESSDERLLGVAIGRLTVTASGQP